MLGRAVLGRCFNDSARISGRLDTHGAGHDQQFQHPALNEDVFILVVPVVWLDGRGFHCFAKICNG